MAAFPDTFNRPDGPLGADWNVIDGSPAIVSNHAIPPGLGAAIAVSVNEPGSQDHYIVISTVGRANGAAGLLLKWSASPFTGAWADFRWAGSDYYVYAGYLENGYHGAQVGSGTFTPGDQITFRATWAANTITAYVNGVSKGSSGVPWWPNNAGAGMLWNSSPPGPIDAFDAPGGATQSMEITPDPLWVGGGPCLVTATGTGTAWSDGESPSTTFSADHGTVDPYRWVSATEWQLIYTPTEYIGPIVFSETQYGLTDTVSGVLTPPVEGGNGLCQLTPAGAELVNLTAAHTSGDLTTSDMIIAFGQPTIGDLTLRNAIADLWYAEFRTAINPPSGWLSPNTLRDLWTILNGQNTPPVGEFPAPRSTPIAHLIGEVIDSLDTLTSTDSIDLQDVLDAISSVPGADVEALRHEVGIVDQETWTSILQVLLGLWGAGADTIESVGDQLRSVQTLSNWTLGNVKAWIEAIPAADLSAVLHKLDHIQPSEAVTLSTIDSDLAVVDLTADQIQVSLGAYRTGSNYTVQDILDAITAVGTKVDALAATGAPVWPGLGSVTLGPVLALADGMTIDGPLHGLIFTLTGLPARPIGYRFGDVTSWSRVGQASFASDRGDYERSQTIAFEQQVMACEKMAIADHARLYVNAGWSGTVRSWTLAP